jgi:hypothetical protein
LKLDPETEATKAPVDAFTSVTEFPLPLATNRSEATTAADVGVSNP